eukprot:GHVH01006569.1.p1 GENE.GHVH01006569.1~~GHVH01006569.1.p1  ORF type:complete len:452 (+),score=58.42 GHVH01006569.1:83-1438(+)
MWKSEFAAPLYLPHTPSETQTAASIKCSVDAVNRKRNSLSVVVPNRCDSVSIRPLAGTQLVPVLACNMDPATINIPILGKVLCTWCLVVLWIGVMFMTCVVGEFKMAAMGLNPMYGPDQKVLVLAGAISPPKLDDGEYWRLLWATQMHAGWIHLLMNVVNFIPLGYLVEPDWGMLKMCAIFVCSALSGSLASVNGSLSTAVGASGGIFGIMGALVIYIVEYWDTIPHARTMMVSIAVLLSVSIGVSFVPFVDKWAHIGGCAGGFLSALMLIRDIPWFKTSLRCERSAAACDRAPSPEASLTPETSPTDGPRVDVARPSITVKPRKGEADGLNEKIRLYRIAADIYADAPSIANPALVKTVNSRAKRFVNIRKSYRSADPKSWSASEDSFEMRSIFVWMVRVLSGMAMVCSWLVLIEQRFGLNEFFTSFDSQPLESPGEISDSTSFMSRRTT